MDGATLGVLIMYIMILAVGLLIYVVIARAIFRVNENTNNMIQQTQYLKDIAETNRMILKKLNEEKN